LAQNIASKTVTSSEKIYNYFNSKVKPIEIKEDDWVLLKEAIYFTEQKIVLRTI
jgi:hypothetical protein